MVVLIRFLIGLVLGGAIMIWGGVSSMLGLLVAVMIAVLTAVWGDDLLLWLMRACRFLR